MKRNHPALFDKVIGYVEEGLAENIPWLDSIFGRAERLVKIIDDKKYYTPNWYEGDGEYLILTPDQGLGNYCFFVMAEDDVEGRREGKDESAVFFGCVGRYAYH